MARKIVYIDPSQENIFNGDGTTTGYASIAGGVGAKNTIAISYLVGNTYLVRVGTVSVTTVTTNIYCLNLFGTAAEPTIFDVYSMPGDTATRAVIDGSASTILSRGLIDIKSCSHVKISGFSLHGMGKYAPAGYSPFSQRFSSLSGGIVLTYSDYVEISDCELYDNVCGISVWCTTNTGYRKGINIHDNDIHDNCRAGIVISTGGTAASPVLTSTDGLRIVDNHVYRTGVLTWDPKKHGLGLANDSLWYGGGLAGPTGGICFQCYNQSMFRPLPGDFAINTVIRGNDVHDNMGYGIYSRMLGPGSVISHNHVYRTGIDFNGTTFETEAYDTHSLWAAGCYNTIIEYNHIHHNSGAHSGAYGSGVGIFLDQHLTETPNSTTTPSYLNFGDSNIVRFNLIHDQFNGVSAAALPAAGIMSYCCDNSQIYGNVVYNCRQGILATGGTFEDNKSASKTLVIAASGDGTTVTLKTQGANGLVAGDVISVWGNEISSYTAGSAIVLSSNTTTNEITYFGAGTGTPVTTFPSIKYIQQSLNTQIENNTIFNISEIALGSHIYCVGSLIRNNLVSGAKFGVIKSDTGSTIKMSFPTIEKNVFYGVTGPIYIGGTYVAGLVSGSDQPAFTDLGALPLTNIYSNPLLNTSTFRVPPASPAVGVGVPMKKGRRGYDGQRFRAKPTIGAIETAARVVVAQKTWPRP